MKFAKNDKIHKNNNKFTKIRMKFTKNRTLGKKLGQTSVLRNKRTGMTCDFLLSHTVN